MYCGLRGKVLTPLSRSMKLSGLVCSKAYVFHSKLSGGAYASHLSLHYGSETVHGALVSVPLSTPLHPRAYLLAPFGFGFITARQMNSGLLAGDTDLKLLVNEIRPRNLILRYLQNSNLSSVGLFFLQV